MWFSLEVAVGAPGKTDRTRFISRVQLAGGTFNWGGPKQERTRRRDRGAFNTATALACALTLDSFARLSFGRADPSCARNEKSVLFGERVGRL
jgi:hypothetical protein